MTSSYIHDILIQIAQEMKRPPSSVTSIIQILEDNWYDTKESIQGVSDQEFEKMKIPLKIVQLIRQKVNDVQQIGQIEQQQAQMVQSEELKQFKEPKQQFDVAIVGQIEIIKSQITEQSQQLKTLETLQKIIQNIVENPLNKQFYTIKLVSKTLQQNIMLYKSAWNLLELVGWVIQDENITLPLNKPEINNLKQTCQILQKQIDYLKYEATKFNPYKAYFSATVGESMTNADVAQKSGYDIYSFSEQLEILKQKRLEIMSRPIQNRDLKIYQGAQNQSVHDMFQQLQNSEDYEVQPSQDPVLQEFLKKIALSLEDQKFVSKRKKEYEILFQRPIYSETIVRIKLPLDIIFECKFSPMETVETVINFFRTQLINKDAKFYFYITPPVQKMTQKYLKCTLDEMDCVPSGLFYIGFETQMDEIENQKMLKNELLTSINQLNNI